MIGATVRAAALLPLVALSLRAMPAPGVARRRLSGPADLRLDEARAAALARAVHRAARFWRSSCLTRAIAIGHLLSREGLHARVTIGVSTSPFSAHAWLEHGSLILAGASPARAYTPLCRIDAGPAPAFMPVA